MEWRMGHEPVYRTVGMDAAAAAHHHNQHQEAQGGVLIYIDNSNIWINTMHYSARKLKFINDIQQDQRVRLNVHLMVATAADKRPIIRCVLYGSEPPPVESFWNNMKDLHMDVRVTKKSTYSNREREVDQNINVDIGEEMVIHREHANYNGTIILFTGDGGMASAVEKAVTKYNWNVEIWSYKHSLAKIYLERFKDQPKVKICLLDGYFDQFAYYTHKWRDNIPKERSFVFTFMKLHKNEREPLLKKIVEAITKLVKLPMSARFIHEYTSEKNLSDFGPAHLALVCNVSAQILKEDSRFDQLMRASNHWNNDHGNNGNKSPQVVVQFSKENWDKLVDVLYGDQDICQDLPKGLKDRLEKILVEILNRNSPFLGEIKFSPKYDFNKDVFHKAETFLESPNYSGDENIEEMKQILKRHRPMIRSMPQFLQDMRWDYIPETRFEAPSKEDGGEEGFQVVTNKKTLKKKFQKYSEPCKHGFRCRKGFECTFSHTSQQLEFFKVQPSSNIRSTYKHKECDHYNGVKGGGSGCKYKGPLSYMCPYAHGTFCLKCQKDSDGGHSILSCDEPLTTNKPVGAENTSKWNPNNINNNKAAVTAAAAGFTYNYNTTSNTTPPTNHHNNKMEEKPATTPIGRPMLNYTNNNNNSNNGEVKRNGFGTGAPGLFGRDIGIGNNNDWRMPSTTSSSSSFPYHDVGRYVDVGYNYNMDQQFPKMPTTSFASVVTTNGGNTNNAIGIGRRPSWGPPLEGNYENNNNNNNSVSNGAIGGGGFYPSSRMASLYPPPGFF